MNLTIKAEALQKALSTVSQAVASRPTLPVLSHVLVRADQERQTLTLAGTDLEQYVIRHAICDVQDGGALTVPARLFNDLAGTFASTATVELSIQEGKEILHVECGKAEADLRGIDAKEFPLLPPVLTDGVKVGQFSPSDLSDRLKQVAFAAATDESRPILTGVFVEAKGGTLSFVTADGFRLALRHDQDDSVVLGGEQPDGSFVMPAKAAKMLVKLLSAQLSDKHEDEVSLWMDGRAVAFRLYDTDIVSQLMEGNFVNYRQIVPKAHNARIVVDRAEIERHLRTIGAFKADLVRLDIATIAEYGRLRVTAEAAEVGEVEGAMEVEMDGDPVEIAFNRKFLEEAIGACGTKKIIMEFSGSSRPGVIMPVGMDNYKHVIMPMHIRKD